MMSSTLMNRARKRGFITLDDVKAWRTAFVCDEDVTAILNWLVDRTELGEDTDSGAKEPVF